MNARMTYNEWRVSMTSRSFDHLVMYAQDDCPNREYAEELAQGLREDHPHATVIVETREVTDWVAADGADR